jgi:hypothetical protein
MPLSHKASQSAILFTSLVMGNRARHACGTLGSVSREEEAMRLQQILWHQLDPKAYQGDGLSPTNKTVVWLAVLSSLVAVVETEPLIEGMRPGPLPMLSKYFQLYS